MAWDIKKYSVAKELAEALGLPKETIAIHLSVEPNAIVEITCRYYPDEASLRRAITVLQRYAIVPRGGIEA